MIVRDGSSRSIRRVPEHYRGRMKRFIFTDIKGNQQMIDIRTGAAIGEYLNAKRLDLLKAPLKSVWWMRENIQKESADKNLALKARMDEYAAAVIMGTDETPEEAYERLYKGFKGWRRSSLKLMVTDSFIAAEYGSFYYAVWYLGMVLKN